VPAICAAVALSASGACTIRGAGALVLQGARPPAQHRTLMASYETTDLREKINHHRGGEDSRTTIEHNRERRRDIEGCNLEKDFDLHAPLPPNSPGVSGRCMALAPHLCMVVWPPKFQPHLSEEYDGMVNPAEFLQIYSTSILVAGGNEAIIANYFLVALTGRSGPGS
jgi:hypothetical protein